MQYKNTLLGLLLVGVITLLSSLLADTTFFIQAHFSALTLAIIMGILIGNTLFSKIEPYTNQGVILAKGTLLRAGIVLYGFKITLTDINSVGINAITSDALMLISTFFITLWIGLYLLKMDKQIVQLTATGCSICGAAAIMAAEPVVKAESHKVAVAIAVIVIFGTISMFLYPIMYPYLAEYLSQHQFGIYIGSSVHEVAQVYAAGENINSVVADNAVITKMIRVMMLAPFLFGLSYFLSKENSQNKLIIPWFAVYFIGVGIFNSFGLLPQYLVDKLILLDNILLMMAMSALGLTTRIEAVKQAGVKPFILGTLVLIWLVVGGFMVNVMMQNIW
ncbi:YeiH family putative sulfate export transporter [Phocoenobacter atlanticus]|uniref:YeiH family putative sulfate export transporter n=1 Tax=Phocoenobacter atlanticus TaxID=3416742 RepID=UPI00274FCC86|nr:YeiH family putative sulfate export transporter [Pasteurella atlantica]MDP8100488.1 YeiH family putative sulfate export transporter [Pasteurella atlantica]